MSKSHSGFLKFANKAQYKDFIEEVVSIKGATGKCMGLETGLMILFNGLDDSSYDEVMKKAVGGTWYDNFNLSLGEPAAT